MGLRHWITPSTTEAIPTLHTEDCNMDDFDKVQEQIENLCYLAVSRPWPSCQRDGVRGNFAGGFDGARAVRVLCAVLLRASMAKSLRVVTDLTSLALEAGLT